MEMELWWISFWGRDAIVAPGITWVIPRDIMDPFWKLCVGGEVVCRDGAQLDETVQRERCVHHPYLYLTVGFRARSGGMDGNKFSQ